MSITRTFKSACFLALVAVRRLRLPGSRTVRKGMLSPGVTETTRVGLAELSLRSVTLPPVRPREGPGIIRAGKGPAMRFGKSHPQFSVLNPHGSSSRDPLRAGEIVTARPFHSIIRIEGEDGTARGGATTLSTAQQPAGDYRKCVTIHEPGQTPAPLASTRSASAVDKYGAAKTPPANRSRPASRGDAGSGPLQPENKGRMLNYSR
jgi:hypothetical protein